MNNHLVIMAGGVGSRFWPMSTEANPKQFIDVLGVGKSLLQLTMDRFSDICPPENVWVVTNEKYVAKVKEQLPQVPAENILSEPCRRNTAPCICYVSWRIKKKDPKANIVVTPSDHIVTDTEEFRRVTKSCLNFTADSDAIVTLGMKTTRPETGYGYIQTGRRIEEGVYKVKSFTEKPDSHFANLFLQEGNFLWNSGLFCFNVDIMLSNLYSLVPEYRLEIPRMMAEAETADPKLVPQFFYSVPKLNVDVSIMERSDNVYVQQGHFSWTDIGTWASLYDDRPSDKDGNVLMATKAFLYDCNDNLVRLPEGRTAVIKGLSGYVIAEEGEILMICPKEDITAMRKMHTDTKFS